MNQKLSDVQAIFRKGRGTRYQMANSQWIIEKAKEVQQRDRNHEKQSKRHSGAQGYDDWNEKCGRELQHQT